MVKLQTIKDFLLLYFTKQFVYFVIAGGSSALLNFFIRLMIRPYLGFVLSAVLSYSIALVCAFFLYRKLVFPFSSTSIKTQGIRFIVIQVSFMPVAIYIFSILTSLFYTVGLEDYAEPTAHIISIGAPALITFLLYKFFVFYK